MEEASRRFAAALHNATVDEEPESGEEKQAVSEAHDWLDRNGVTIIRSQTAVDDSHQLRREFLE